MKKIYITLTVFIVNFAANAQIRAINGAPTSVTTSSAFLDASSNATYDGSVSSAKGIVFPRVDLTTFTFLGVNGTSSSFRTRYDGFIVYNTATSGTALVGTTTGTLTRGFWYYDNSSAGVGVGSVTGGTWKPINSGATNANLTGMVTSNGGATTVVTNANLTGVVTSVGNTTAIANGAITNEMLSNSAVASLSGINTGDQDLSSFATTANLDLKADKAITVNGQSLASNVILAKEDIALGNVDNTSDASKPISDLTQLALNAKANSAGQVFTGEISATNLSGSNTGDQDLSSFATTTDLDLKADKAITVNGQSLASNVILAKEDIALGNVDNTSDASKPISDLTQLALNAKANSAGQIFTGEISATNLSGSNTGDQDLSSFATTANLDLKADKAITVNGQSLASNVTLVKGDVGLGSVDNTSDLSKPISTDTQSALDAKANSAGQIFTGEISATNLSGTNTGDQTNITGNAGTATLATNAISALTALNATNTIYVGVTDDTASATALYPTFVGGTNGNLAQKVSSTKLSFVPSTGSLTATSFKGDGSQLTNVTASTNANLTGVVTSVGNTTAIANGAITNAMLSNSAVASLSGTNTGDQDLSSFATTANLDLKAPIDSPTFTGTPTADTQSTTDDSRALASNVILAKEDIALGNVDNTSDASKPISDLTQIALDAKANSAGQIFTGEISATNLSGSNTGDQDLSSFATTANLDLKADKAITVNGQSLASNVILAKEDIALGNVDNTSDASKPISDLTQIALDAKANSAGQVFTGEISATNLSGSNTGDQDLSSFATTANLDLKAPLASPAFTGTPTAVTQPASDSSTALATTEYVTEANAALVSMASNTLSTSLNNYLPLTGGSLGGALYATNLSGINTGDQTDITGNAATATTAISFSGNLAGDVSGTQDNTIVSKINGTSLADLETGLLKNTSDSGIPTIAVEGIDYVSPSRLSTSLGNYLPLAGGVVTGNLSANNLSATNLSGTNTGDDAVNSRYQGLESNANHTGEVTGSSVLTIANNAITTLKIADASVTDEKIDTVNGSKVVGNILGNAANVTGRVALENGGTGATTAAAALTSLGAAPIASPAFTGTPTADTPDSSDDSNKLATTAFVKTAALATSALGIKDITPNEIALSTKINGSQLYAITGSFQADGDSTLIHIQRPSNMSGYYTFVTYQNGKTFRKEVYSLNINNINNEDLDLITGSGPYSEVYPLGTYQYVLEYFKNDL